MTGRVTERASMSESGRSGDQEIGRRGRRSSGLSEHLAAVSSSVAQGVALLTNSSEDLEKTFTPTEGIAILYRPTDKAM